MGAVDSPGPAKDPIFRMGPSEIGNSQKSIGIYWAQKKVMEATKCSSLKRGMRAVCKCEGWYMSHNT